MTQQEAKSLFIKHAGQSLEKWGFKLKKTKNIIVDFKREKPDRHEEIFVSTLNFQPQVVFQQGASMYIHMIEKILLDINEKFTLNIRITNESRTLHYIGRDYSMRRLQLSEVNGKDNEQGVIESANIILNHIENDVLPMFNLFNDIREIDKRINGEGENWGEQKDFTLGPIYGPRSWIIARLSKTNDDFDIFINNWVQYTNKRILTEKLDAPFLNPNDQTQRTIQIFNYLRERVSPIY